MEMWYRDMKTPRVNPSSHSFSFVVAHPLGTPGLESSWASPALQTSSGPTTTRVGIASASSLGLRIT